MAMANTVLCMNGGDQETIYANSSLLQKTILLKTRPIIEDTIKDMFNKALPTCSKIADLGCASGPNTFFLISQVINTVQSICCQQGLKKSPEFQVFLNDLPGNDFNTIFRSVPGFYSRLNEENRDMHLGLCFIAGVPGSFYGRLFPEKSMHFIHSSYSVHWLSEIPVGLENNKRNIYMAKSSPPDVLKAYSEQFQKDFSNFLRLRSEEIISGGRMLLTLVRRTVADPTSEDCCYLWELLAKSLFDLVAEGQIEESDLNSFNMPYYNPYKEVWDIIQKEGSFDLDKLEIFEVNWDNEDDDSNKNFVFNKYRSGQNVANCIRAVTEPMLTNHFGETVIDNLFTKYAEHVDEHLSKEKTKYVNVVISMIRK